MRIGTRIYTGSCSFTDLKRPSEVDLNIVQKEYLVLILSLKGRTRLPKSPDAQWEFHWISGEPRIGCPSPGIRKSPCQTASSWLWICSTLCFAFRYSVHRRAALWTTRTVKIQHPWSFSRWMWQRHLQQVLYLRLAKVQNNNHGAQQRTPSSTRPRKFT